MPPTVLVVDDVVSIVRLVEVHLERAGYRVAKAYNGHDAMLAARSQPVHLIVLDLVLPIKDGFQVIEELREAPQTANIPVVVLLATPREADREKIRSLDLAGFIPKPFNPRTLISTIGGVLPLPA